VHSNGVQVRISASSLRSCRKHRFLGATVILAGKTNSYTVTNMPNVLTELLKQPSTKLQYMVAACMGFVAILQGVLSTNAKDEESYASSVGFWLASRQRQFYCVVGSLLLVFALYRIFGIGS
jgi:hypothetical protein